LRADFIRLCWKSHESIIKGEAVKKSLVEQIQMALSPDAAEGNEDIRVNSLAPIGGEGSLPWRTG